MNSLIGFFVRNRVAVAILVFMMTVMGIRAWMTLPREAAPDLKIPVVLVTVPYPGVSPTDIETLVVRELENKLKELRKVKVMRSTSAEGAGIVSVEFDPDIDIDDAVRKVREKVDLAKPKLPKDALEPVVKEISFEDFPIITVNLSANYSLVKLKQVGEDVQDVLEDIPGVLEVKLAGGVEREIQVLVDAAKLTHQGVSIGELQRAIGGENVNTPGGVINVGRSSYLVRIPGEFKSASDVEDVIIKTRGKKGGQNGPPQVQTPLRVRDVATVLDTFKERTTIGRLNEAESVNISVSKRAGENIIRITDDVKRLMKEMEPKLPPGTKVTYLQDQSKFTRSMVGDLQNNVLAGLLLVLAVLPFCLTVRSSIIVASAIPLALLISLTTLQLLGITLNMIVLFALILSLGMLVDNSIVVVENTYRLLAEGETRTRAALRRRGGGLASDRLHRDHGGRLLAAHLLAWAHGQLHGLSAQDGDHHPALVALCGPVHQPGHGGDLSRRQRQAHRL